MYHLCDGACSANIRDDLSDSCIISVMAPVVLIVRDDLSDSCIISVMAPVMLIVRDDLIHVSFL